MSQKPTPSTEDLALLSRVLRDVGRSRNLTPEDAQDFAQSVHLKMIERDYDVFRRFAGRSSLRTYLTVVVSRLLLDWRNSTAGKWRASSVAVRLGDAAVRLERLIHRDGHSLDEAVEVMLADIEAPSADELRRMAGLLPPRQRRRTVSSDALLNVSRGFEDPLEAREEQLAQQRLEDALADAINRLPVEEQELLRLRYENEQSVQLLARMFETDARKLYGRFDRTLRLLRRTLLAAGAAAPAAVSRVNRTAGTGQPSHVAAAEW